MDNQCLPIDKTIIIGEPGLLRDTLALIAQYKGRYVEIQNCVGETILREIRPDEVITIEGFWPIVEYLEARYPHPSIYLPGANQAGVVRSLCHRFIRSPDVLLKQCVNLSSDYRFILGRTPTLLDFLVYVAGPPKSLDHFMGSVESVLNQARG